jgi:hypothetical protein
MKTNHISLLILAITVTIFVASIYGYLYYKITISGQKISEAQYVIESAKLAKEREKSFLDRYTSTASKWASLQDFFVHSDKVVDFIEVIESLSSQSKSTVTISSIDADNLDNAAVGKEGLIRVKINAKGSWVSVMRALSLVEVLPYKMSINNVRLNVINNDSGNTKDAQKTWELNFDLQVAMIVATSSSNVLK